MLDTLASNNDEKYRVPAAEVQAKASLDIGGIMVEGRCR